MIGQQVPYTISQNVSFDDQPDQLRAPSARLTIRFPPSCRSSRARPPSSRRRTRACSGIRSRTRRRMRNSGIWASSAGCSAPWRSELTYAGSAGKHLVYCYNPNEMQPGIGSQESRRLIQPLNRLNEHAAVRSPQPLDLSQRPAQGHAAVQRRPAVPRQLHLRQGARLRRIGRERRRRGGQSADGHEPAGRPRPRRDSTCAIAA